MGLFSSKKKVYVSSVVYNLLGDKEPTKYLPTTVFSGVLNNSPSLGTVIKDGLLNGPGMRLRSFFRWVRNSGYADEVGLATSVYYPDVPINKEALAELIKSKNQGYISVEIVSAEINKYDYTYIADWYVFHNRKDKLNDEYTVEEFAVVIGYTYKTVSEKNENGQWETVRRRVPVYRYDIRITYSDGTKDEINSSQYNKDTQYLYITYLYTSIFGSGEYYIIYAKGSGIPEYDALFVDVVPLQRTYAPYIPIRTWNQFLSEDYIPTSYKFAKRAFKKAIGSNDYDSLIKDLKENKSIGDIDFAYIVFGVSLNTKYEEGKRYIFTYLYNIYNNQDIAESMNQVSPRNIFDLFFSGNKRINIKSDYGSINFNIWLEWGSIDHYYGVGLIKPDIKPGQYHFYAQNKRYTDVDSEGEEYTYTVEHSYFCHQITSTRYEVIEITGFSYSNLIYKGKSVDYTAMEAFNDNDYSGFIIPLQEQSFKESGLVYTTQLAQSTYYCVFNCYVVKKVKWYQSGIFGFIITIVVTVIVTIVTWNPAAGGAAGSAAASAGAAAGAAAASSAASSALASAVMSAVVNAIAGVIVLKVITSVATGLFGDTLGSIIGAIASIVVMSYASAYLNGTSMAYTLTKLSSATNLLKLANAVVSGISGAINADAQDTMRKTQKMAQEYQQISEQISKMQASLYGQTLDISSITDALRNYSYEPRDAYLTRTLMTGSDIAETTMDLIHSFVDYSLSTELNV